MSYSVMIIPEDFTKDGAILQPLVEKMMSVVGKPRAKVIVCPNPRLRGVAEALNHEKILKIVDQYRQVDLFLVLVDRDGDTTRHHRLRGLEQAVRDTSRRLLLAEHAWQELEVWLLAGLDLPSDWVWQDIRAEPHPKERYFEVMVRQHGLQDFPYQGRGELAKLALKHYPRLRSLCPEDIQHLEKRLREIVASHAGR